MLANYVAIIQIFPRSSLGNFFFFFSQAVATIMSLLYPGARAMRGLNCIASGILVFLGYFVLAFTGMRAPVGSSGWRALYGGPDKLAPSQCLVHGAKFSSSES